MNWQDELKKEIEDFCGKIWDKLDDVKEDL